MRTTRTTSIRTRGLSRSGLTLVELLVIILILYFLLTLVLPAIDSSRPARRTECLNNIRQLGLAIGMYESVNGGRIPRLSQEYSGTLATRNYGWSVELLDYLEGGAVYDVIRETGALVDSNGNANAAISIPGHILKVFTCPDHIEGFDSPGGISYAANLGYVSDRFWGQAGEVGNLAAGIDWDGSGTIDDVDYAIHRATAVFLPPNSAGTELEAMTIQDIARGDGTSNTFLFLENNDPEPNWASPAYGKNGVGISVNTNSKFGPPSGKLSGAFDTATPEAPLRFLLPDYTLSDSTTGHDSRVNSNPTAASERAWRPKSSHTGVVLVCFADKSAKTLNEEIDEQVFARMFTPNGTRGYGQRTDGKP